MLLEKLYQEQYGLTQIVFSKFLPVFESSNQDTKRLEPYCSSKILFFYFKTSLTIKSHGQCWLTRIVHLDQFIQSLSKMV